MAAWRKGVRVRACRCGWRLMGENSRRGAESAEEEEEERPLVAWRERESGFNVAGSLAAEVEVELLVAACGQVELDRDAVGLDPQIRNLIRGRL